MNQGDYISETTENLIRRAQRTMNDIPVLDLTDLQNPRYVGRVRSLTDTSTCHYIAVKNTINYIDGTIVVCSDSTSPLTAGGVKLPFTPAATCTDLSFSGTGTITYGCPTPNPGDYVNMVATFKVLYDQAAGKDIVITFKYLINDVTYATDATFTNTLGITGGTYIAVQAFGTNTLLNADDTWVLWRAEVKSQ